MRTREIATQFCGNHAAIQADLVPPGLQEAAEPPAPVLVLLRVLQLSPSSWVAGRRVLATSGLESLKITFSLSSFLLSLGSSCTTGP